MAFKDRENKIQVLKIQDKISFKDGILLSNKFSAEEFIRTPLDYSSVTVKYLKAIVMSQ